MSLLRMSLTNYRCFEEPTEIELRPLTIVLGRNNSGKSALVRAPLVLETGMRTESEQPLNFDAIDAQIAESFTDLIYGHRPHGNVTVRLDLGDDNSSELSIEATIQHITEFRLQVLSALSIVRGEQKASFEWTPETPREFVSIPYRMNASQPVLRRAGDTASPRDITQDVSVRFRGLLPRRIQLETDDPRISDRDLDNFAINISEITADLYPTIRYFAPFRDRPVRRFLPSTGIPRNLGSAGENTGKILAADFIRQGGHLLQDVNEIFGKAVPGWSLGLAERGDMFAVVLESRDDPTISVNLVDAGTGVAQALPIFVQRALDILTPPRRPVLEVIEEPELHLHPAAHGGLADLYLATARDTSVRFLIETHSETFLLRVRRRIAEGTVSPDAVAVYFVEHERGRATARRININESGVLDYWPEGIFSEDYDEARGCNGTDGPARAAAHVHDRTARSGRRARGG
jgi:hypothetical protein